GQGELVDRQFPGHPIADEQHTQHCLLRADAALGEPPRRLAVVRQEDSPFIGGPGEDLRVGRTGEADVLDPDNIVLVAWPRDHRAAPSSWPWPEGHRGSRTVAPAECMEAGSEPSRAGARSRPVRGAQFRELSDLTVTRARARAY